MSIKLNGATSGSVALDVPAVVGGDFNLSLPGAGTVDRLERTGNILQVVEGSTSTEVIVSTTTFTDTGLSATITPTSATSKVLVIVDQQALAIRDASAQGFGLRLYRDATLLHDPMATATNPFDYYGDFSGSLDSFLAIRANLSFLDSPSTTSAVTYKTQGRPSTTANTGTARFQSAEAGNSGSSRIILMEVAG